MVVQRFGVSGGKAEVEKHQYILVFRQSESVVQLIHVHTIQPTAIDTNGSSPQHHVSCHYGSVLYARIALAVGIDIHIVLVKANHKYGRRTVATGRGSVYICESLSRLHYIYVLLLQVLGCRRKASGFKYCVKLFGTYLPGTVILLARVTIPCQL